MFINFKNLSILFFLFFASFTLFGQWKTEKVNNGFDEPFVIAKTNLNSGCYLKLYSPIVIDEVKVIDSTVLDKNFRWAKVCEVSLDLIGSHFCGNSLSVDLVLKVNGIDKKYTFNGLIHENKKGIEILKFRFFSGTIPEFQSPVEFITDFELATSMKIRVNDPYCEVEIYEFNMKGSKAALSFISQSVN